ncbi:hypothetical protein GLOIN_2v1483732 [Rhizophagus irregularis DAOM 181602=DAOM 197198]|nr:hypothetical protein GLOIN_2v1483732 [Rhizophagus irregularis DAOM 181602=DAOM 197198]
MSVDIVGNWLRLNARKKLNKLITSIDIDVQLSSPEVIKKSASTPSKTIIEASSITERTNWCLISIFTNTIGFEKFRGNKSLTRITKSSSTKEKNS